MRAEPYICISGPKSGNIEWFDLGMKCGAVSVGECSGICHEGGDWKSYADFEREKLRAMGGRYIEMRAGWGFYLTKDLNSQILIKYAMHDWEHDSESSRLLKRAEFLKAVCEKEGVEWLPDDGRCKHCGVDVGEHHKWGCKGSGIDYSKIRKPVHTPFFGCGDSKNCKCLGWTCETCDPSEGTEKCNNCPRPPITEDGYQSAVAKATQKETDVVKELCKHHCKPWDLRLTPDRTLVCIVCGHEEGPSDANEEEIDPHTMLLMQTILSVFFTLLILGVLAWINVFVLPREAFDLYDTSIGNCTKLQLHYTRNFIGQTRLASVWCDEPISTE